MFKLVFGLCMLLVALWVMAICFFSRQKKDETVNDIMSYQIRRYNDNARD